MKAILLVTSLFIGFSISTKFHFQAKLICNLEFDGHEAYHYSVSHWDRDWLSADDLIDQPKIGRANGDVVVFSDGYQSDDGASFMNFEVYSYIKHNCTDNGEQRLLKIDLGKVRVALSDATLKYDAVLSNNGTKVGEN